MRAVLKTWILQGGELWKDIPGKDDKCKERHRSMKDCSLLKEGGIYWFDRSVKHTRGFKRKYDTIENKILGSDCLF